MDKQNHQKTNRTLLKVTATEDYLIFRTFSRTKKRSGSFYVRRGDIAALALEDQVVVNDGAYFGVLCRNRYSGMVEITFYWTQPSGNGHFTGWRQTVTVPWRELMEFAELSELEDGPEVWKVLSVEPCFSPRIVFMHSKSLKQALANRRVRRKLFKFLRSNFRWRDTEEIILYGDFVPYSFFFRERRFGQDGMCGGVILHGQEDMRKAYYSIHT